MDPSVSIYCKPEPLKVVPLLITYHNARSSTLHMFNKMKYHDSLLNVVRVNTFEKMLVKHRCCFIVNVQIEFQWKIQSVP